MIPFSPRRSPTYTGDGVVVAFDFAFKVFTTADIAVRVSDLDGVETQLDLGADYTVSLNGDQSNFPGGTVTLLVPLADGYKLVIIGALEYKQSTQLPNGGSYNAVVVERALDSLAIQAQQLLERADRTLILAATAGDGVSTALPAPAAVSVIGWDAAATGLRNYNPGDLGVAVSYANWQTQVFNGTGAQTAFVLTNDAGAASNIDLRVNNVPQTPGVNFSYDLVTKTITFLTGAPGAGTGNVVARYGQALPQGTLGPDSVTPVEVAPGTYGINISGNAATATTATTATSADAVTGPVSGASLTDNTVTPAKLTQKFTVGAAIPTTSGANIDINSVFPSWARHIRLGLVGVSHNGTDPLRFQLGDSGGIENSGYSSNGLLAASGSAAAYAASTAGFDTGNPAAATFTLHGIVEFISSDGLTWACVGNLGNPADGRFSTFGGSKTLSAALDRIRVTTPGGANTFDTGFIIPSWQ